MKRMVTQRALEPAPLRIDKGRAGRRIGDARRDRGETVEALAAGISGLIGYDLTPQTIKNMEAGRTNVHAWMIPVFAEYQQKSLAWYHYDDPYNVGSSNGHMRSYLNSEKPERSADILRFPVERTRKTGPSTHPSRGEHRVS